MTARPSRLYLRSHPESFTRFRVPMAEDPPPAWWSGHVLTGVTAAVVAAAGAYLALTLSDIHRQLGLILASLIAGGPW